MISLCSSHLEKCFNFIGEKGKLWEKGNKHSLQGERVLIVFKYIFSHKNRRENKIEGADENKKDIWVTFFVTQLTTRTIINSELIKY